MGLFDWLFRRRSEERLSKATSTEPRSASKPAEGKVIMPQPVSDDPVADILRAIHGGNEAIDHEEYAKRILAAYAQRHFGGTREAILSPLRQLLTHERRTLFQAHTLLAQAARILVCCADDPEIREWGVDLLGRVGEVSDVAQIVELANNDEHAKVRQEATAALGRMLRFRTDLPRDKVKKGIVLERQEGDQKTLAAREIVLDLLKQ